MNNFSIIENETRSNASIVITSKLILNLISGVFDSMALLICFIYLCVVIYHIVRIKYNRGFIEIDASLILSINIICSIFIKSSLQINHITIPTIMNDFHIIIEFQEIISLRIRAYILRSMVGIVYWSYALLAFFRFVRILYPAKRWLHRSSFYLYILIPSQCLCIFIMLLPLFFGFDSLHLISNEAFCDVSVTPIYAMIYVIIITYYIPTSIIFNFYVLIARKIRQSGLVRQENERNRRDYLVIRRMSINIIILNIVAIPGSIIFLMSLFQNNLQSLFYHVEWISSSIASCLFSLLLPSVTTRLRDFLIKSNRLTPTNNINNT